MAQYRGAVIGLGWMGMLYDLAKRTGTWHGTTLIAQRPSSTSIGSSIFTIIPARKVCPRPTPRHCGTGHRQQRTGVWLIRFRLDASREKLEILPAPGADAEAAEPTLPGTEELDACAV